MADLMSYSWNLLSRWAVLPLMLMVFCPSLIRGSCGDYVVRGNHERRLTTEQGHPDSPKSLAPGKPSRPCNGPMCSGSPFKQPLTHSPLPNLTSQDSGMLLTSDRQIPSPLTYSLSNEMIKSTSPLIAFIFHPPRAICIS